MIPTLVLHHQLTTTQEAIVTIPTLVLHHQLTVTQEATVMKLVLNQGHHHPVLVKTVTNQGRNLATMEEALHVETVTSRVQSQDLLHQAAHHQETTAISQDLSRATMVATSTIPAQVGRLLQLLRGAAQETAAPAPMEGKAVNKN